MISIKSSGTESVVTDAFFDFLHVLKFCTAQSVEYFVVVKGFVLTTLLSSHSRLV